MDRFQLLLQFAFATSLAEVQTFLVDAPADVFVPIIEDFEQRGLLERVGEPFDQSGSSIVDHLAPAYRSDAALASIGHHLSNDRCVVLENAFESDLAERVHAALVEYTAWRVDQDYSNPNFSFHHHRTPDHSPLPDAVLANRR